ncbi:TetR family transcriptional regulator [Agromyces archimandritae]|uniref:TetR family transcriptional regulator n=1 Tax=Agromyces archimandritae TaxID=2781962 RepID=A0A975FNJ1_9MICO|nr:TetR family transcriptional regulator [Agromyces archimandritae]QTX05409.1 TetR family transcriptional regulator [Agromyces archimandritae]
MARTGRPPIADVGTVRAAALETVIREGYGNVTMSRIADEVGLSLRTLHRYFPTKADLVWGSIESSFDIVREALSDADERTPLVDAVATAMSIAFDRGVDELETSRQRLRLIATTPELQAIRSDAFERWRTELVAFIARRLDVPESTTGPRAAAAALQAAMMEGLARWAVDDDPRPPSIAVTEALEGLRALAER